MAEIVVRPFKSGEAELAWDQLVAQSYNGTMLHTRRYLGYHGDRFADQSLWIERDGQVIGVFAAAVDPKDGDRVVSHPGLTYGGMIAGSALHGELGVEALTAISSWYRHQGFSALGYKPVPHVYHRQAAETEEYALFRLNASCYRVDLCSVIDLGQPRQWSRERRYGLKRAEAAGIEVTFGREGLDEFWPILQWQLSTLHGVQPVHEQAEMEDLMARFPAHIALVSARYRGEMVAGVVTYFMDRVVRAQYSASSQRGRTLYALNPVFDQAIQAAVDRGHRYFDFGNSNEADGRLLNQGLHRFKFGFGARDTVQRFYQLTW